MLWLEYLAQDRHPRPCLHYPPAHFCPALEDTGHFNRIFSGGEREEQVPANTLILDFEPPELSGNKLLVFKPYSLPYLATAPTKQKRKNKNPT